jgi:hypothetical protein
MRSRIGVLFTGIALAAIAASAAPAQEARDFRKPGPFPVGVRTLVLVDASRQDAYSGGPRSLVTEVWYPAVEEARGAKATTFSEFFGRHQDAARLFVEHFKGKLEEVEERFRSIGVRGAALRAGKYPLLVFSHGNGGVRHQSVFQLEHLASHGYVVASPDHTGNAGVTPLPEKALPYDRQGRASSAAERPRDVSFLITRLLEESRCEGSWLRGALDGEKIGVLGHSFGGFTACKVAETDERVKAILPMTVAYGKRISVPLLVMVADRDRTMGEAGNVVARAYYQASTGPKHLVAFARAGHFTFSDMDRINPTFGDGIGKDRRTGEEFLPIDEAKALINAYSLAFFERYLRGDAAAAALLSRNLAPGELFVRGDNLAVPVATAADKARVLIVTGDDVPAHDWRATTPVTREILEADPRLEVFVAEDPAILESSTLGSYAAVVLNFRTPPPRDPSEKARENLSRYVEEGGGLVVLHFGVFAFSEWPQYRDIVGRVWVGRSGAAERSGHGSRGSFKVRVVDRAHPACEGLEDFETDDELYAKLHGDAPIHVLVDAHSEWSGAREPIAWTREFGKGRVLVNVLGHDAKARNAPPFAALLRRGTAWVAGLASGSEPRAQ